MTGEFGGFVPKEYHQSKPDEAALKGAIQWVKDQKGIIIPDEMIEQLEALKPGTSATIDALDQNNAIVRIKVTRDEDGYEAEVTDE